MFSILVVEDDEILNKMICAKLKQEQYKVLTAFDGEEAVKIMENEHIDLIISDIMMPNMDGYELTKELRSVNYNLPILMVTAKNQIDDMENGFLVGADDYMIKPINLKEMIIRVKALLRRAQIVNEKKLSFKNTVLDYESLTVMTDGEQYEMPPKQFYLLFKLLSYPNKIFTRLDLLDEIWGMEKDTDERNVDAHIKKIRKKFENNQDFEIMTIRGLGYKAKFKE
ncbi:response regulator transcription factor [Clostridium sp.]|uniref:response regulator transcription factor n=1 Tax=Clostridium sp. TaxID=1506 RepID=UPI00290B8610|nr:response regulator transcription factor [Clostridium sp.]MDU5108350.1 response regulator transcription factor [Clostridium sp.]